MSGSYMFEVVDTYSDCRLTLRNFVDDDIPITQELFEERLKSKGRQLKILEFTDDTTKVATNVFKIISKSCPNIFSIGIGSLQHVDLENAVTMVKKCKKLRKFLITDREGVLNDDNFIPILTSAFDLENLRLIGSLITRQTIKKLPSSLKELNIRFCRYLTTHSLSLIRQQCPNLVTLSTSFILDQNKLTDIRDYWPNLQICSFGTKTRLDYGCMSHLKELNLDAKITDFPLAETLSKLTSLDRFSLKALSVIDEVIPSNSLKELKINTRVPLPDNIIMSLPYFTSLKFLLIKGSDIWFVVEDIIKNCIGLLFLSALDTVISLDMLRRLMLYEKPEGTQVQLDICASGLPPEGIRGMPDFDVIMDETQN